MKTPEQMAEEYGEQMMVQTGCDSEAAWYAQKDFLAGYQAAKELYEAKLKELEIQLENWQHNAIHGDEGL